MKEKMKFKVGDRIKITSRSGVTWDIGVLSIIEHFGKFKAKVGLVILDNNDLADDFNYLPCIWRHEVIPVENYISITKDELKHIIFFMENDPRHCYVLRNKRYTEIKF